MNSSDFPRMGENPGGVAGEKNMVMERMKEGKSFRGASPVLVEKTIQSHCGTIIAAKKTREGKIFVTVRNESQAKNLAKIEKLVDGITVKIYEHKSLNSCKVVVFCRDVKNDTDDAIRDMLSDQGVLNVKQITKGAEANKIPTGIFVITVKGTRPPKEFKLGYLLLQTRPLYPNPLKCFKCLKFGHTSISCPVKNKKCSRCSEVYHEECGNVAKCINCGGGHGAFSKECPVLQKEKSITKVKVDRNISFWEARNIVESESKTAYSDTVISSVEEDVKKLTNDNKAYVAKINELNEEKKMYADTLKAKMEVQFETKLMQYKEELIKCCQENEKKVTEMQTKIEEMQERLDSVHKAYKEEKYRRKIAEKEAEKL
ncbi:uncharacterized protein LOC134224475 [Armigeres subalbatus]|uniref:uncharacterized protein LOC134224475 n=1 Tax=Armigeres subalbatus TaxID=124917 RepID=UPI002ED4F9BE